MINLSTGLCTKYFKVVAVMKYRVDLLISL